MAWACWRTVPGVVPRRHVLVAETVDDAPCHVLFGHVLFGHVLFGHVLIRRRVVLKAKERSGPGIGGGSP